MNIRKDPLVTGHFYHIFSRSIAKFVVFNEIEEFSRFIELLDLYRFSDFNYRYSKFVRLELATQMAIIKAVKANSDFLVEIIAFCVMPTHIHLLLKQSADDGISKFISKILNSYSRYFNLKHYRTGPLWEGKFKNVEVLKDEQLLHLTRYIHLNPTSAGLVKNPEDWVYSSYREYICQTEDDLCHFDNLFDHDAKRYRQFVNDWKSYQRDLSIIKKIMIDNYSG